MSLNSRYNDRSSAALGKFLKLGVGLSNFPLLTSYAKRILLALKKQGIRLVGGHGVPNLH